MNNHIALVALIASACGTGSATDSVPLSAQEPPPDQRCHLPAREENPELRGTEGEPWVCRVAWLDECEAIQRRPTSRRIVCFGPTGSTNLPQRPDAQRRQDLHDVPQAEAQPLEVPRDADTKTSGRDLPPRGIVERAGKWAGNSPDSCRLYMAPEDFKQKMDEAESVQVVHYDVPAKTVTINGHKFAAELIGKSLQAVTLVDKWTADGVGLVAESKVAVYRNRHDGSIMLMISSGVRSAAIPNGGCIDIMYARTK